MFQIIILGLVVFILFSSLYLNNRNISAEEVITIIPGSSDQTRERFFDITYYPIKKGTSITWNNADNISHEISVLRDNITLAKSEKISPNGSFEYTFETIGTYIFVSPEYHWMKGIVNVTKDVDDIVKKDLRGVDVELAWTPKNVQNSKVYFKIIFTDSQNKRNYEHVDYILAIKDVDGKTIFQDIPRHSGWGVEQASYKFKDIYRSPYAEITITSLLFQPIEQITSKFQLQ